MARQSARLKGNQPPSQDPPGSGSADQGSISQQQAHVKKAGEKRKTTDATNDGERPAKSRIITLTVSQRRLKDMMQARNDEVGAQTAEPDQTGGTTNDVGHTQRPVGDQAPFETHHDTVSPEQESTTEGDDAAGTVDEVARLVADREKKRKDEEAAAEKKRQDEEAEKQRKAVEAARLATIEEKKRKDEEAAAEKKRQDEEAEKQREESEAAEQKKAAERKAQETRQQEEKEAQEMAERQKKDQEEKDRQEAEAARLAAIEEKKRKDEEAAAEKSSTENEAERQRKEAEEEAEKAQRENAKKEQADLEADQEHEATASPKARVGLKRRNQRVTKTRKKGQDAEEDETPDYGPTGYRLQDDADPQIQAFLLYYHPYLEEHPIPSNIFIPACVICCDYVAARLDDAEPVLVCQKQDPGKRKPNKITSCLNCAKNKYVCNKCVVPKDLVNISSYMAKSQWLLAEKEIPLPPSWSHIQAKWKEIRNRQMELPEVERAVHTCSDKINKVGNQIEDLGFSLQTQINDKFAEMQTYLETNLGLSTGHIHPIPTPVPSARSSASDQEVAGVAEDLERAKQRIENEKKKIRELDDELEEKSQESRAKIRAIRDKAQKDLDEVEKDLEEAKSKLRTRDRKISDLEDKIRQLQRENSDLRSQERAQQPAHDYAIDPSLQAGSTAGQYPGSGFY